MGELDNVKNTEEEKELPEVSENLPEEQELPEVSENLPEEQELPEVSENLPEEQELPEVSENLPEEQELPEVSENLTEEQELPEVSENLPEEQVTTEVNPSSPNKDIECNRVNSTYTESIEYENSDYERKYKENLVIGIFNLVLTILFLRFLIVSYKNLGEEFKDLGLFSVIGVALIIVTLFSFVLSYMNYKRKGVICITLRIENPDEVKSPSEVDVYDLQLPFKYHTFEYESDGKLIHSNKLLIQEYLHNLNENVFSQTDYTYTSLKDCIVGNTQELQEIFLLSLNSLGLDGDKELLQDNLEKEYEDIKIKNILEEQEYLIYLKIEQTNSL